MDLVVCPHCNSHRLLSSKVPKDVVVVMPCPACSELVILFREKVVALQRSILEKGTKEERKLHLAEIISEFLDPAIFKFEGINGIKAIGRAARIVESESGDSNPISDREVERFSRIQLEKLDNPDYFKRHFS